MSSSRPGGRRPEHVIATQRAKDGLANEALQRAKAPYRPVLVVLSGPELGKRVILDRTLTIGRDTAADLVLTDSLVSYHHARVEDRGDSWTLIDLGSTNGTSVNGARVTEIVLEPGTRIVVGNSVLGLELQDREFTALVERLLTIDDLSGLWVRRKFDAETARLLKTAEQEHQALALLVMDLDGIKQINDAHGHLFGAYVIGESGRVIGAVLGRRGIASRFGGDEFVAALPKHDVAQACLVAEEIRKRIAEHPFVRDGIPLRPGISIGVAAFPENACQSEALFEAADAALYRAKRAGKNRVST